MALDETLPVAGPDVDDLDVETTGHGDSTVLGHARGPRRDDVIPERIGRFAVVRRLGAGAMGVVLAARDERLDRPVALKLLRRSGREDERIRLRREAQALAQLSHPNVVQVFEVGSLGAQAYLVMELVDGVSLDRWLQAAPRAPREVLEVFGQAGEGLAAAHAAGLVHRDFKPGNVLVGVDGRVRVADFGLAQLRPGPSSGDDDDDADDADDATTASPAYDEPGSRVWAADLTRTGAMIGTPAYMSPEQLASEPVTAASDQFSFCVALYEALYIQHPFVEERRWNELVHNVLRGRPRPPPDVPHVPARLRDAVLRGLAKDPRARWPSMPHLLSALRAAVRPRRWVREAGVAVTLVGLAGGAWGLVGRNEGESRCTGADAKLAEVWGPQSRAAVERAFLATGLPYAAQTWERVGPRLDDHAEAWRSAYAEACAAGAAAEHDLDRRMACLERLRGALGAQVAVFMEADAAVVEQAVVASDGLRPAAACLRSAEDDLLPPEDPELASRYHAVEQALARLEALERSGAYAAALPLAEQALVAAELVDHPALAARARLVLAELQRELGHYAQAEEQLEQAYFLGQQLGSDALAGRAADALVLVVGVDAQDYARGLEWARHAEVEVERSDDALRRADHLGNLGVLLTQSGDYERALPTLEESLAVLRGALAPGDVRIGDGLGRIGIVLRKLDDDVAAARHHEQALAIYEQALGADHPEVARALLNLAAAQFDLGLVGDAVGSTQRAVAIVEAALGADHVSLAPAHVNLAVMLLELARHEQAEQAAERALVILERAGTQPHTRCAALVGLANVQHARGQYEDAARTHRRAVAAFEEIGLGDHPDLAQELVNYGDTLERLGELPQAEAVLQRALAIFARAPEPVLRQILVAHELLAYVGLGDGRWQDAIDHAERRIALEPDPPTQPHRVVSMRFLLARARWGLGRRAREQALRDAHAAERAAAELPAGVREDRLRHELRAWRVEHDPRAASAAAPISRAE